MVSVLLATTLEEMKNLYPLIEKYVALNHTHDANATYIAREMLGHLWKDTGVLVLAFKDLALVGYLFMTFRKDCGVNVAFVDQFFSELPGAGPEMFRLAQTVAEEYNAERIVGIVRNNVEAISRMTGTRVSAYVLEKEL